MIITTLALAACLASPLKQNADLHDPFGIAWGFLYGYEGVPASNFMKELRGVGGSWTKLYLIWNQVEPKRGEYDWRSLDTFLAQIKSPDEALISVFSASTWATRTRSEVLPPSPAKEPKDYDRFVRELVRHCKGRVRYFQNDSEPNNPIYWSGTASEFADETTIFFKAVRETDSKAQVILGGYDGLFNPGTGHKFPGQEAGLAFFRQVLTAAPNSFDLFDLRLYADPSTIPTRVAYIRKMMAEHGQVRPIICTEYNGPGFFEFVENRRYAPLVSQWAAAVANQSLEHGGGVSDLYKDPKTLAPQTQMFLLACEPELEAKLRRIQCSDLVKRNVFALSSGVRRTLFWDFWHDTSKRDDVMTLMYGKLRMFDFVNKKFEPRHPLVDAFLMLSKTLKGVKAVRRIEVADRRDIVLFEADCGRRGPVYIAWKLGDAFLEQPADTLLEQPCPFSRATAKNILGADLPVHLTNGRVSLLIGTTPIFIFGTRE